jgi:hypothetical protein
MSPSCPLRAQSSAQERRSRDKTGWYQRGLRIGATSSRKRSFGRSARAASPSTLQALARVTRALPPVDSALLGTDLDSVNPRASGSSCRIVLAVVGVPSTCHCPHVGRTCRIEERTAHVTDVRRPATSLREVAGRIGPDQRACSDTFGSAIAAVGIAREWGEP